VSGPTTLVLWRHGVTDWNEKNMFQGRADIPLNDAGLAQAARVAPTLAGMRPDAVYCSPMVRARRTAQAVLDLMGQEAHIDERLAEIDVGTWVGRDLREVSAMDAQAAEAIASGRDYRRSPTGETMTEVGERVGRCLRQVAAEHDGQTVLVVSHGGAIRMGVVNLMGWTYEASLGLGGVANCAWSRVILRRQRWRLDVYNCGAVAG